MAGKLLPTCLAIRTQVVLATDNRRLLTNTRDFTQVIQYPPNNPQTFKPGGSRTRCSGLSNLTVYSFMAIGSLVVRRQQAVSVHTPIRGEVAS